MTWLVNASGRGIRLAKLLRPTLIHIHKPRGFSPFEARSEEEKEREPRALRSWIWRTRSRSPRSCDRPKINEKVSAARRAQGKSKVLPRTQNGSYAPNCNICLNVLRESATGDRPVRRSKGTHGDRSAIVLFFFSRFAIRASSFSLFRMQITCRAPSRLSAMTHTTTFRDTGRQRSVR